MIRTNPGQPSLPLRGIASGGELSRLMLAIKSVLSEKERVSVLVFDEIDAKIGGRLGAVIGSKLRSLAEAHQVLCITHLPQIAAYADQHIRIEKESDGNETRTIVRPLRAEADRLEELAEMLAGRDVTAATRKQAGELRRRARSADSKAPPSPPSGEADIEINLDSRAAKAGAASSSTSSPSNSSPSAAAAPSFSPSPGKRKAKRSGTKAKRDT